MSDRHEDLVAFALGELDADAARRIEADPTLAEPLEAIRSHLRLHERVPEVRPHAGLWRGIQARLEEEEIPRSLVRRFWMPLAAAALLLLALFLPRSPRPELERVFGEAAAAADEAWTSQGISRMRMGTGVVFTLDDATTVRPLAENRLALLAGRAFFEVAASRRGFVVEAGELTVVTTGTAFLVEWLEPGRLRVWTESGRVRCDWPRGTRVVEPGEQFVSGGPARDVSGAESPRAWFRRPTLSATVRTSGRIRVVVANDTPDPIILAPPTGGEPLFFVSCRGHDHPLSPTSFAAPITILPRQSKTFAFRLPDAFRTGEPLFVSYPARRLRVEATR
jgi:ferric-dicitrate binding protein FerR (iron transport regulator)